MLFNHSFWNSPKYPEGLTEENKFSPGLRGGTEKEVRENLDGS